MAKSAKVPVDVVALRANLKATGLSMKVLCALCGYSDPSGINKRLQEGCVPSDVYGVLTSLGLL